MNEQEQYGHYALFPNYQDLFSQDAEYNPEIIADYEYAPRVRTWGEMHDATPSLLQVMLQTFVIFASYLFVEIVYPLYQSGLLSKSDE